MADESMLTLPPSLRYPVRIHAILAGVGTSIRKGQALCTYSEAPVVDVKGKGRANDGSIETRRFDSSIEGTLQSWAIKEGQSIQSSRNVDSNLL